MAITAEKALLNNQSILQNFALVEEINEQSAEIISGGYEVFTIRNTTGSMVICNLDGSDITMQPGEEFTYSTYSRGIIEFDADSRDDNVPYKSCDLEDGQIYEFRDNTSTPNNPYDIDLYRVS
jgi:hypothetical protein